MKLPKNIDKNLLIKLGAGIGAYFFILKPLLQKLNIIDDKDDKAVDQAEQFKGFSPTFWSSSIKTPPKDIKTIAILSPTLLTKFTTQLYFALKANPLNEDEEAISDVFKRLTTHTQLSQITDVYNRATNSDLYGDLKRLLSSEEFRRNIDFIKQYKLYHPKSR